LPPTPYSLPFPSCLLTFCYGFVFGPALSRGLLVFFSLSGSLKNQEMKMFSSNPFEDLELVGFTLRLGCSKLGTNIGFLFLARLGLVRGAWTMKRGFLSRICTFFVVSGVVGNVLGGRNDDRLHNLGYFFSKVSAAF
jgi:hypothetical protein